MHSLVVGLSVFGVIFLGELPDKTAIACLVLGARYKSAPVLVGAWAAFLFHVVLAVLAGGLVAEAPRRPVELVTSLLFLLGAILLLRSPGSDVVDNRERSPVSDRGSRSIAGRAFGVVLVAEFGDVTQILTASLAARYDEPVAVGLGALGALWAVGAIAVLAGTTLLRFLPLRRVQQLAAGALTILAVVSFIAALRA